MIDSLPNSPIIEVIGRLSQAIIILCTCGIIITVMLFSLRHTLTMFVRHSIMAHIPWPLNQPKPDIAISNDPVFNNGIYSHILANIYFP